MGDTGHLHHGYDDPRYYDPRYRDPCYSYERNEITYHGPKPKPAEPPVPATPLPSDDDHAKVERRQAELDSELRRAIAEHGEAGWRSPFCTGLYLPAHRSMSEMECYATWRTARDNWTVTGDTRYLRELRNATDFRCPPDAPADRAPAAAATPIPPGVVLHAVISVLAWCLIVLLLAIFI